MPPRKKKTDDEELRERIQNPPDGQILPPEVQKIKDESPDLILKKQLQAPFPATQIVWKRVSETAATAYPVPHDAAVTDRLDEVFGVTGWTAAFENVGGSVRCTIQCLPDGGGSIRQSALSSNTWIDALVSAAGLMGIGRYLLRVGPRPFGFKGEAPKLPDWALPNTPDDAHPYHGCGYAQTGVPVAAAASGEKAPTKPVATQSPAPPVAPSPATDHVPDAKPEAQKEVPKAIPQPPPPKVETVDQRIKAWMEKLTACTCPEDLNALLPGIKGEREEHKASIKKLIAKNANEVGWFWDDVLNGFAAPHKTDWDSEAIPF